MSLRALGWLARGWLLFFLTAGLVIPLVAVGVRVFTSHEASGFLDPSILAVTRFTVFQAGLSTALSVLIGLPIGLTLGQLRSRTLIRWNENFLSIAFAVPTVVTGAVGIRWLGREGLDWAYSLKALILAHAFLNGPWVALMISQARARIPGIVIEGARTLGAGPLARFYAIYWPHLRWALLSCAVQIFSLCAMSFALVLILGGGPPVETLETALYGRIRYGVLDIAGAASCAFWQLIIGVLPWAVLLGWQAWSRTGPLYEVVPKPSSGRDESHSNITARILANSSVFFILPYLLFLVVLPWRLLFKPEIRSALLRPAVLSIWIAGATACLALATAGCGIFVTKNSKRYRWILPVCLAFPSGVSALALGLGLWLAYANWIDPFDGSLILMIALQGIIFLPIAFRSLWPVALASQPGLLEAARSLGASELQAFYHVEWPRWRGPVLSAFALIFAFSLGEVSAVSLFYSEEMIPLPLLLVRWMNHYRFQDAELLAGILLILSATAIIFARTESAVTREYYG